MAETQPERDTIFDKFTPPICQQLDKMGIKYTLKARIKSPYSIWMKMQNKHIPFSEVNDLLAIRIVFVPNDRKDEVDECYRIYGALTKIYKPHPTLPRLAFQSEGQRLSGAPQHLHEQAGQMD